MTIEISAKTLIIILIIFVSITEHLFNWWIRNIEDDPIIGLFGVFYILRGCLIYGVIDTIIS